jgi:hypothetical protein
MAMRPARLWAESAEVARNAESIHQETFYKANCKRIFDPLTETSQFDRVIHIATGGI